MPGHYRNLASRVQYRGSSKEMRQFTSVSALFAAAASLACGQTLLTLPEASQRAVVTQRIGVSDVTITYHRPLVNGRKVWGGIVPYDQVWRAGANENTTIAFSDPVAVEGQPLAKGTYGLHMMPGTDTWTVIFSKASTAWGSFSYKQAEDSLRVTVKPQPAEFHEALTYDFDDVKPDSAVVTLRWEKLAVPFRVSTDEKEITLESLRTQLRGGVQYTWEGWAEAADYCLTSKTDLDEGLRWADRSIAVEERFDNVMLKSQLLDALHRDTEATAAKTHALELANVTQLYFFARQLQAQKQPAQAMDVFRQVARRYPEHWLGHMAVARLSSSTGDYTKAIQEIKIVQGLGVPEQQKANLEALLRRLEAQQDINQ